MKSPKISKRTIEQEIDLGEVFGVDATDAPAFKEAIGQAIIDAMIARTRDGKGIKFGSGGSSSEVKLKSPYSDPYIASLAFKAAGKKKSEINMELTGDMLASVDLISTSGNKLKIAVTGETEVLKAFNHITGDTVPERPWFGISKNELEKVGFKFKPDIEALSTRDLTSPRQQRMLDLLDAVRSSNGEGVVVDDE